ncbi:cation-independent mannose-6-phosphate receptor-like isoform X1 [Nasonia vitripennis]|uniref:MRH domain-containing protein n=2 Tax=Nasonia vitripennis TaxID=7425 RepID=A0A7M7Q1H6_NASVI|nr:cation-independent mannose-6-phosphate receptor-like isoform X1 [Nasonia vitripennis]
MHVFVLLFVWFMRSRPTLALVEVLTQDLPNYNNYCRVEDPTTHLYTFDFSALSDHSTDKKIRLDRDNSFRIQFCRHLVKPCNGKNGYSVCYSRNGTEVGIGAEPPQIDLSNGTIVFRFTGDACNATHNYTLNFKMKCDYAMKKNAAVDIDATDPTRDCNFDFVLETFAACPQRSYTDCIAEYSSDRYNLNALRDFTKNYEVHINDDLAVILNVCHSLLYGPHHVNCSDDSSICLIDKSDKSNVRYANIGSFQANPLISVLDRNDLLIIYDSDAICYQKHINSYQTIKSTIEFVCDLNATDSAPEYIGGLGFCHYKFIWRTIAACSEKVLHDQTLIDSDFCRVKDPLSRYEYDLSSFKNRVFKARTMEGTYAVSVCSFMDGSVCKTGTGVCKLNNQPVETNAYYELGESGGTANGKLMWKESGPYLNYTDGDVCDEEGTKKYTIISFLCSDTDSMEVEDKTCQTSINFYTSAVCKRPCAMSLYDMNFERLIQSKSNYVVKTEGSAVYHINVCRPLVNGSQFSDSCSNGTGICKADIDEDGESRNEVNLGYPDQNLRGESDGSVVLTYTNGSLCQEDDEQRISTRIKFVCDLDHAEGTPRFLNYHNCTYYFEWRTKLSCGTVQGELDDDKCQVTNVHGDVWDLSGLNEKDFHTFSTIRGNENHTFRLSLCGRKSACNNSYVCDEKMSYGRNVTVSSDYRTNMIKLHFTNGSRCTDGSSAQSTLYIKCNESAVAGELTVLSDEYCKSELEWSTHAVCKPQHLLLLKSTVHLNSLIDSTAAAQIVGIILLLIFVIVTTVWFLHEASRRALCTMFIRKLFHRCGLRCGENPSSDLCL